MPRWPACRDTSEVPRKSHGDVVTTARLDRALVVTCVVLLALCLGLLCTFGYGRDQGIYAMVAKVMLEGGMPYRDVFDFKPPGIFFVFGIARALLGDGQHAIRVFEAAGLALTVWGMSRLTRRHWGDARIGLIGGTIFAIVHVQLDFWHTAQPESFGGMLSIAALCTATRAQDADKTRRRLAYWIATGVLFGLAGLMKPPLAGGGAVLALWVTVRELCSDRHAGRFFTRLPRALGPLAWILVGGVAPFAVCIAWFAIRGAAGDMHEVLLVFTPHYTKLSWVDRNLSTMVWTGVSEWLTHYSSLVLGGLVLLVALRPSREELPGVLVLVSIIGIQLVGVIMQGKFFPYHYGATWPLAGLLAALGYFKAWQRCASRGPLATGALMLAVVLVGQLRTATHHFSDTFLERSTRRARLFVLGPRDQIEIDGLATVADVNAGANRAVARHLAEHVPEGRPVFVWGFEPVIYDLANRPSATRYIYNVPQRTSWQQGPLSDRLMQDLAAKPPAAIVVEHGDVFPFVTGSPLDSASTLDEFPELADLLTRDYRATTAIQDFDIYFRK